MADKIITSKNTQDQTIGFRMVKEKTPSAGCTPDFKGIFLPSNDDFADFVSDNYELELKVGSGWPDPSDYPSRIPSFIPIQVVGVTCGEDILWDYSFNDTTPYDDWDCYGYNKCANFVDIAFHGNNSGAVVGWYLTDFPIWFYDRHENHQYVSLYAATPKGTLTVSAQVKSTGEPLGTVTINFTWDYGTMG